MYNPAYISCVVQPLQIKYISIPRVGSGGVHSIFYSFDCFEHNYNGDVIFIWKSFKSKSYIGYSGLCRAIFPMYLVSPIGLPAY